MNEQHGASHSHHTHHFRHRRGFLHDLEKLGDEHLVRKAPLQIPHKWKAIIAKLLPILVLVVAIVSVPGIVAGALFVLGFAGHGMMGYGGVYNSYRAAAYPIVLIQLAITIAITVFYFKAFNLLRAKKYLGWVYVFYGGLLGLVVNLIDGGIVGALVGFLISMYLLFQAKELYH